MLFVGHVEGDFTGAEAIASSNSAIHRLELGGRSDDDQRLVAGAYLVEEIENEGRDPRRVRIFFHLLVECRAEDFYVLDEQDDRLGVAKNFADTLESVEEFLNRFFRLTRQWLEDVAGYLENNAVEAVGDLMNERSLSCAHWTDDQCLRSWFERELLGILQVPPVH